MVSTELRSQEAFNAGGRSRYSGSSEENAALPGSCRKLSGPRGSGTAGAREAVPATLPRPVLPVETPASRSRAGAEVPPGTLHTRTRVTGEQHGPVPARIEEALGEARHPFLIKSNV